MALELGRIRLSPLGMVEQQKRHPRWICDCTWSQVNDDTLTLVVLEAMQFRYALGHILGDLLLSNPEHGPVKLNKTDHSNVFYQKDLNPYNAPKLWVLCLPNQGFRT